jgi:hypothetical protein
MGIPDLTLACIMKHFTDTINSVVVLDNVLVIVSHILMAETNTLAFYPTEFIALGGNLIKTFSICHRPNKLEHSFPGKPFQA